MYSGTYDKEEFVELMNELAKKARDDFELDHGEGAYRAYKLFAYFAESFEYEKLLECVTDFCIFATNVGIECIDSKENRQFWLGQKRAYGFIRECLLDIKREPILIYNNYGDLKQRLGRIVEATA